MKPVVSVIIPLYNKESTVTRAINSVLSQTISNFELIIVDGHSTDASRSFVNSYNDLRIRLYDQVGNGVSAARNQGIHAASGELIAFLDADDTWESDFLETILSLQTQYPEAGLYGTGYSVYSDDIFIHNIVCRPEESQRVFESYFKSYVEEGRPIIITSACASPKSVLLGIGGFPENMNIGEDHELFSRIALHFNVAYSPKICATYFIGSENNADMINTSIVVPLENYYASYSSTPSDPNYNPTDLIEYLDNWRIMIGARNIYSGFRFEGRKQLFSVTSSRYNRRKNLFLLLSYLPVNYSKIAPNKVRRVLRKFHMSI